jgi:hypothetical protein
MLNKIIFFTEIPENSQIVLTVLQTKGMVGIYQIQ